MSGILVAVEVYCLESHVWVEAFLDELSRARALEFKHTIPLPYTGVEPMAAETMRSLS
jgi:hypothetical protein